MPEVPALARAVEHHSARELPPWRVRTAFAPRYTPPETRSVHAIDRAVDEKILDAAC